MINHTGHVLAVFAVVLIIFTCVESSPYSTDGTCPGIYSCKNCTAIRLCNPNPFGSGFVEYKTANCSASTPYCDPATGSCTATPTNECTEKDEMTCLQDGTFPHPTDCRKYFICINLKSHTIPCTQSYYFYDSFTEKCIYNKGCYTFNCNNYNGYKIPYPNDRSIYTYCVKNGVTLVNRCYGKDELNTTSQQCEPVCRYEGLIPDTSDSTKYYRCSASSVKGQFQMTSLKCPNGHVFSKFEFQCLPPSQLSSSVALPTIITSTSPLPRYFKDNV